MLIRCPECAHTRQINEEKIPAGSEFATCPKCQSRFRFRTLSPEEQARLAPERKKPAEGAPMRQPEADPAQNTERGAQAQDAGQAGETPAKAPGRAPEDHTDVWSAVEDLNARWEQDRERTRLREAGEGSPEGEKDQGAESGEAAEGATPDAEETGRSGRDAAHADKEPAKGAARKTGRAGAAYRRASKTTAGKDGRDAGEPTPGAEEEPQYPYFEDGRPSFFANSGSVPWEYKGGFLHPIGLARTILLSFSRIPEFFGGIPARGSLLPALVFALLMRGLQFTFTFAVIKWDVVSQQGEQLSLTLAELTKVSTPQLLITTLFIVIFLQFLSTLIVNFMVRLVEPTRPNFNVTFKILAYSLSPLIFIVVPQVGMLLAEIGSLLLFTLGLRHAYRLSWVKTMTVMLPLILLMVLLNMNSLRMLS